jgi:hypothetical protein
MLNLPENGQSVLFFWIPFLNCANKRKSCHRKKDVMTTNNQSTAQCLQLMITIFIPMLPQQSTMICIGKL